MYKKLLGLLLVVVALVMIPSASMAAETVATKGPLSPWIHEIVELLAKGIGLAIMTLGSFALKKFGDKLSDEQKERAEGAIDYLAKKACAFAEEKIEGMADKYELESKGEAKLNAAATKLMDLTGLTYKESKDEVMAALPFVGLGATAPKLLKEIEE